LGVLPVPVGPPALQPQAVRRPRNTATAPTRTARPEPDWGSIRPLIVPATVQIEQVAGVDSDGLPGRVSRRPRPLEVVAAQMAGHIDYFADEIQPRHAARFHGFGGQLSRIHTAGC